MQETAEQYARSRRQHKKVRLAWRRSKGARRSLGWLPFKVRTIKYAHGQIYYAGKWLSVWDSWGLGDYELRAGNLSEDSRGRWYLNVTVNIERPAALAERATQGGAIGVDLGLKDLAALSDGRKVAAERFYRDLEARSCHCAACGEQASGQVDSLQDRQPTKRFPAQAHDAHGARARGDLCGRCECKGPGSRPARQERA